MEANKQEGFLQGYNTVDDFVKVIFYFGYNVSGMC